MKPGTKGASKARTRRKVWFGVGACVVIGSGTATAVIADAIPAAMIDAAGDLGRSRHVLVAQHGEHAQEAGEAGESESLARLPPALAFATRLALVRGHLLIGNELVKLQQWNAALPHFLHPGEELYGGIKEALATYNVAPFDAALGALADVVKAKQGGSVYANALAAVDRALAAADAAVKAGQDNWPGFLVETAVETLKAAAVEYKDAIVAGRIAKPVEYQDARGFIWQAAGMIESVAADLQKKDAGALAALRAQLQELKKVFPAAMPPKAPVKDAAAVLADVSRIELTAGKLM
jgi:hypothetical protein